MKKVIIVTALFVDAISCFGQKTKKIFIPKEIKLSIEKGRRINAGIPGENFFVNNADIRIMYLYLKN